MIKIVDTLKRYPHYTFWCFLFISFIWYFPIFSDSVLLDNDSVRFMFAAKIPHTSKTEYWLRIFISEINFKQYRPFSFFAIYYILDDLLIKFPMILQIIGFSLFSMCLWFFYRITVFIKIDRWERVMVLALFIFHFTHMGLFASSFAVKYYLPFFILIYFYEKFLLNQVTTRLLVFFTVSLTLSIMSHEGSFVFVGFYFLVFHKQFFKRKLLFFSFIPAICYLYLRLFILRVPDSGTFDVSFTKIFLGLSYYFNVLLSYPFSFYEQINTYDKQIVLSGIIVFMLFVSSVLFRFYKTSEAKVLAYSFALFLLISPFALISNHIYLSRMIWIQWFVIVSFFVVFPNVKLRKIIFLILVLGLIFKSPQLRGSYIERTERYQNIYKKVKSIVTPYKGKQKLKLLISQQDVNNFHSFILGIIPRVLIESNIKSAQVVNSTTGDLFLLQEGYSAYLVHSCQGLSCRFVDPFFQPMSVKTESWKPINTQEVHIKMTEIYNSLK